MTTIFCMRPSTRNIGNDIIALATSRLLRSTFGPEVTLVQVPALAGPQYGGLVARQIYDMNRLADGVVIGGGNLFENGQISLDLSAFDALEVPLMIMGVSYGRVCMTDRFGRTLSTRSDAISKTSLRALVEKASVCHLRDLASIDLLNRFEMTNASLGGCPTLFLPARHADVVDDGTVLLSIRHPERMSVPAALQWRIPMIVDRTIAALAGLYGKEKLRIVCHDYKDIEFAKAFSDIPFLYFDSPGDYFDALSRCRQSVSFRLHAFLPCFALGVPSIHLSYDERGRSMMETIEMTDCDVDVFDGDTIVDKVLAICRSPERYVTSRQAAQGKVKALRQTTDEGLAEFAKLVHGRMELLDESSRLRQSQGVQS